MNPIEKEVATKAIGTMCRAAIILLADGDATKERIASKLGETALAVKKHYQLEDEVMDKYNEQTGKAKSLESLPTLAWLDVDAAQDVVFDMCQTMTEVDEVYKYLRTAREMQYYSDFDAQSRETTW